MAVTMSRRVLFDVWRSEQNISNKSNSVFSFIIKHFALQDADESVTECVRKVTENFCVHLKDRWHKSHYILKNFQTKNSKWLNGTINFPDTVLNAITDRRPGSSHDVSIPITHVGRPKKDFEESSDKTKRRRMQSIVAQSTSEQLVYAAQMSLHVKGNRDAAEIVKQIVVSPKRATRIKKAFKGSNKPAPVKLTNEEALALYVDAKLTKKQYLLIRKQSIMHNANIYPSYNKLLEAKKKCYPNGIVITENSAEIQLQALLDHTINRLLASDDLKNLSMNIGTKLTLLYKWGCDGASGQSTYRQMYSAGSEGVTYDDAFLFVISLVPLQLRTAKMMLWNNPRSSSTRYCRPIKLLFKKETAELTQLEVKKVEDQIRNLSPTEINYKGSDIIVEHKMMMTMVDGKVCSTISQKSFQKCYICGAAPKEMNDLASHSLRPLDATTLTFGLSSLHSWIRCFECLLHIAYRLELKTWQVRKDNKEKFEKCKKIIQDRFRKEMGLLVDIPKPGYGTSNNGNTARKFFSNPVLSASITGIDENLIKRFTVLLRTIASGYEINHQAFETFAMDTAKLYVELYPWYYMPASVHKLLIHGGVIVQSALLPIGQLSEEAQEARNKDCRNFREHHARKMSRRSNIEDLIHMLLLSSDPLVTSIRKLDCKIAENLPDEMISLLKQPPSKITMKDEEESTDEDLSSSSEELN